MIGRLASLLVCFNVNKYIDIYDAIWYHNDGRGVAVRKEVRMKIGCKIVEPEKKLVVAQKIPSDGASAFFGADGEEHWGASVILDDGNELTYFDGVDSKGNYGKWLFLVRFGWDGNVKSSTCYCNGVKSMATINRYAGCHRVKIVHGED